MAPVSRRDREEIVRSLWQDHMEAAFPARLRGEALAGTELVLLDADVAGCVSIWCSGSGRLDSERQRVLRRCLDELERVLALLSDPDEVTYFRRLRDLARSVLE